MNRDRAQLKERRARRQKRVRANVQGTRTCPRLSVFHSNAHSYAQLIDDGNGVTLVGMGDAKKQSGKKTSKKNTKTEIARELGRQLAKEARKKGIAKAVFDRSRYAYHGRTKAIAEGAREGGLSL